ncbi:hypothetical protein PA598K_05908 [Paenibacillus sp. 598K]|uniref:DUF2239 family protein n=1 Tax=Paenibacillus sp. 598K TaxID=1117987 RepID=UPI000FF9FA37|nr:DUF2239 family protein [Paenibacillus sp. 598K]GBF77362.1 hypothetical protein PA598K_05908 [Paenibacillus sp. 598K]
MSTNHTSMSCTAFLDTRRVATGSLQQVITGVKAALDDREQLQLLIFDDGTGKPIDVDLRGKTEEALARLGEPLGSSSDTADTVATETNEASPRRAGRPKLGVVSGEVTLLPRHWEWLKSQPGGASVTLRKLIDEARRAGGAQSKVQASQEATYCFMTAMAGDFPRYEEALRLLYAGDSERFYASIADWAPDITSYIQQLAVEAFPERGSGGEGV